VFPLLVALLGGRLQREQEDVLAFRREENRVLKRGSMKRAITIWVGRVHTVLVVRSLG